MTPVNPIPEGEEVRRRIVDAAEARFRVYGYRKTTMAEIAEDVDMSAANLYRYFEDKQDIAAACAGRCMGGRAELLREVVKRPGLAAAERLDSFVLTMLRYTHDLAHNQKKINELVEIVASERPETVREKNRAEQALIAEILAQGNANRDGRVDAADLEVWKQQFFSIVDAAIDSVPEPTAAILCAFALIGSTASPDQGNAAQQVGLFLVPRKYHR